MEGHLSIGIDVGTTTFHYVVNRIYLEKQPSKGGFPRYNLTGYDSAYQSPIFLTPYRSSGDELDKIPIVDHIMADLAAAGFSPAEIATGSVIVTGQAAKKANADGIIAALSALFPQMVSTIAGSKLESLLAARGARVDQYSRTLLQKIMNIDIGGGTTNIALFQNGKTVGLASLWLGGRMIRLDEHGRILNMTSAAKRVAADEGLDLSEGASTLAELQRFADGAARCLFDFIAGRQVPAELIDFNELGGLVGDVDALCFTGGVAEIMRSTFAYNDDWLHFEDLGVLLAERISARSRAFEVLQPDISRIRATAIGVGVHHLQIAGSTIYLSDPSVLPLTNIPVAKLSLAGVKTSEYLPKLAEATEYSAADTQLAYCFEAWDGISYEHLTHLAGALLEHLQHTPQRLLIAVFDRDLGKIFGYIAASLCGKNCDTGIISIDGITLNDNTTLDVGVPLAEGVLPVCAKTLFF